MTVTHNLSVERTCAKSRAGRSLLRYAAQMRLQLFSALPTLPLAGCALQVTLPADVVAPAGCAVEVVDTRPEPDYIYAREVALLRLQSVPTPAVAVRAAICASSEYQQRPFAARFVITDFDCQVSGMLELRAVADLRGRLEVQGQAPQSLRVSEVAVGRWARIPDACQGPVALLPARMAAEVGASQARRSP